MQYSQIIKHALYKIFKEIQEIPPQFVHEVNRFTTTVGDF